MAFNSGKCVSCTEPTKRDAGNYHGKDEKGNYSGPMYICDNTSCSINYERRKLHKHIKTIDDKREQEKMEHFKSASSSKQRQNKGRK